MKSKDTDGLRSGQVIVDELVNKTQEMVELKRQYYLYGKIRYIVSDGRCDKLRVLDVAKDITEEHYKKINRLYGLNKNEINMIIKNMAPLQKVES